MGLTDWAYDLAESLLADRLPQRWAHSQRVLSQARRLAPLLDGESELLAAAAVAHDVGYAPEAVDTGQHMIDGARYLRDVVGADARMCSVVAYHTSSPWEAAELGLSHALAEFEPVAPELIDAITYCDLTSGPTGDLVDPVRRLDEVLQRYGPDHVVFRAVSAARPNLLEMVERVEKRSMAAGVR